MRATRATRQSRPLVALGALGLAMGASLAAGCSGTVSAESLTPPDGGRKTDGAVAHGTSSGPRTDGGYRACPDRSTIHDGLACAAADLGLGCLGVDPSCGGTPENGPFSQCTCGTVPGGSRPQWTCGATSCTQPPRVDAGVDAYVPWKPGIGRPCTAPIGSPPSSTCDPSDETAPGCHGGIDPGCTFSPKCGDLTTCEPFTANPPPGTGVDSFRMRLINLTAPPALVVSPTSSIVVTSAVDLPSSPDAGGAPCGENGSGLFNWLLQVDKTRGTVKTGGAPPSADPFGLGYCFADGTITGHAVAPVTLPVTFQPNSNTFSSTEPGAGLLNLAIFLPPPEVAAVVLPIRGLRMSDVSISDDGNCIGAVNNAASTPVASAGTHGVCADNSPSGPGSCSRWHSAGAFGGYISLADADTVQILALGGESLCAVLTGQGNGQSPQKCSAAGRAAGDYCSQTGKACAHGDSDWISGQFAASAVTISAQPGVSICNHGSL